MGRGGGRHGGGGGRRSGGGGGRRSGGGARSHYHSSHRSHGSGSRSGSNEGTESLAFGLLLSLHFIALCIGLFFIAAESKSDALCGGITSINRWEQLMCTPPKTQDVRISRSLKDLTAYRYDIKNLPETTVRTSYLEETEWVSKHHYKYFNFGLLPGGFVKFTYRTAYGDIADFYLMTFNQYVNFANEKPIEFEWCNKSTTYASYVFTAKEAGVYYIVVDANYTSASVFEKVNITTPAYKLSEDTAKDVCKEDCIFKKVSNNETVILEYLGEYADVRVKVFSGKGPFQKSFITPIVIMCVFILLSGAGSALLIYNGITKLKKSRQTKVTISATTEAQNTQTTPQNEAKTENTPENDTPAAITPEATIDGTPYSDPTAPLIPCAVNNEELIYYGTAPPSWNV